MNSASRLTRLLVATAVDAQVYRQLREAPEETFLAFELSEEEKELLRRPDHRLLRSLGAAFAQDYPAVSAAPPAPALAPPPAVTPPGDAAQALPDLSLVLTVQPCALFEEDRLRGFSYAAWVNPLPEGGDPASFGPPAGSALPGRPLTPLHAVVRVSALQMQDAAGQPQIGLTAWLLQASNMVAPPPHETACTPGEAPSEAVRAAAAAVHGAAPETRYGKLIELLHALRGTGSR